MMCDVLDHIIHATRAKPCGCDRWLGHCISHGSRNHPDLSIRKTNRRILVFCFAACPFASICDSLGIVPAQLFLDSPLPRGSQPLPQPSRPDRHKMAGALEIHGVLLEEEAQTVLNAVPSSDCRDWTDHDFDAAWLLVAWVFERRERAQLLYGAADWLRERAFQEGA